MYRIAADSEDSWLRPMLRCQNAAGIRHCPCESGTSSSRVVLTYVLVNTMIWVISGSTARVTSHTGQSSTFKYVLVPKDDGCHEVSLISTSCRRQYHSAAMCYEHESRRSVP